MPSRRHFFIDVAVENQQVIFPTLIETDPRVEQSLTSAKLYRQPEPLAPLQPSTAPVPETLVRVVNFDSFDLAGTLTKQGVDAVTVLNMANADHPGGSYLNGSGAQEEALCRRSTLHLTLCGQFETDFHPIPPHGGIYSPDVLVFRSSDDANCALLASEAYWWTSVISVAAIDGPRLKRGTTEYLRTEDWKSMMERIRTILRIAAHEGRRNLVLGAFGCGVYGNPPKTVAAFFAAVFKEEEFKGRFEGIWFAVIERGGSQNFAVFKEALDGMEF
jgi:uncharacterized protein (TIGR02452 family)